MTVRNENHRRGYDACMPRTHKQTLPSLSSLPPIEIDPEPTQEVLTSFAGLSLVAETLPALGLSQSVERNLHLKERQRGFSEAQMVQSLLMMLAAGGESVADNRAAAGRSGLAGAARAPASVVGNGAEIPEVLPR